MTVIYMMLFIALLYALGLAAVKLIDLFATWRGWYTEELKTDRVSSLLMYLMNK